MKRFYLIVFILCSNLFSSEIVNHVNVISGKLQLSFEDHKVNGGIPLSICRSYNSAYTTREGHPKWNFTEGWNFFSHTHIYVDEDCPGAKIMESDGSLINYVFKKSNRHILEMHPEGEENQKSQAMNYRENPLNNRLDIDRKNKAAVLYLADGGKRRYKMTKPLSGRIGRFFGVKKGIGSEYVLEEEISSSGHVTKYTYLGEKFLTVTNAFSSINLFQTRDYPQFKIKALGSDGKELFYSGLAMMNRCHLIKMEKEGFPTSLFSYVKDPKTEKLWVENIVMSDKNVLNVTYQFPTVKKTKLSYSSATNFVTDYKIQSIAKNGEKLCDFIYTPLCTTVRDCNGVETKYYHSNGVLNKILYADNSYEKFVWEGGNLVEKSLYNSDEELVFSKLFQFDGYKNMVKETIKGDQSYSKWYTYNEKHLCIEEREETGLVFQYEYLKGTDLVTCKRTKDGEKVLIEEHTQYDENNLIKKTHSFDGFIESKVIYTRDPKTGLVTEIDNGLETMYYKYNDARQVIEEGTKFASITFAYDTGGRVICKTFPLGGKEEYTYDQWGNPIHIKTIGSPKSTIEYDTSGRPLTCDINGRVSRNIYDKKGNIVEEIDYKGVSTKYTYDIFGRCIKKTLPLGVERSYEYDVCGNVVKEISPTGFITKTSYNLFNKPIHIAFPDGGEIFHSYTVNGELKETTYQDGSKVFYKYDILNRLLSKKQGLLEEFWEYEGMVLKRAIHSCGLVTIYEHDRFGRKISEDVEGRKKEFFYDEMGNLSKTQQEDISTTEIFDIEGRVVCTHINDCQTIHYVYDEEGRKSKTIKFTNSGDAEDHFFYDDEGRLIRHLDPLNQETLYVYDKHCSTKIDPLGNQTVEYFNELSCLIQKQKLDASGGLLFSEKFFFDKEGNVIRECTEDHEIEVTFDYDCMNRLIRQVESGGKTTSFTYDLKGHLLRKTLPDGHCIDYQYNDLDQITAMRSSDGTISYEYFYTGMNLTEVQDHILNRSLLRSYTKFGEIAQETGVTGFKTSWFYDTFGRKRQVVLPDNSTIDYDYDGSYMRSISRFSPDGHLVFQHTYLTFDPNGHVEEESLPFNLGTIKSSRDLLERSYKMTSPFHNVELTFGPTSLVATKASSFSGEVAFEYDNLEQLSKEGASNYCFDSLGNPTEYEINNLNQIVSSPTEIFTYNAKGDLVQRGDKSYKYDALGHLIEVITPDRKVTYSYDPFSRLASKQVNDEPIELIFYDQAFEIGKISIDGTFLELKVLGLGIKGDIGAAIALEINEKLYVPLHDLQGNIIAIIDELGNVEETYSCNAFGEEEAGSFINPWRFSSKRNEEGLVFFGHRFYDPLIKRWITPDPQGFTDSRNLYLYVLNSPLNRLDQFGLEAEFIFKNSYSGESSSNYYYCEAPYKNPTVFCGSGRFNGVDLDMMMICRRASLFELTNQERINGEFNLMDKLPQLMNGRSDQIGAIIYTNGINTKKNQFGGALKSIANMAPEGSVIMGVYNPTQGLKWDVWRVSRERNLNITPNVTQLSAFLTGCFDIMEKNDVESKMLAFPYSGAGATLYSSYMNMSSEDKKRMREHTIVKAIAPAIAMPMSLGPKTRSIFSKQDWITGTFAAESASSSVRIIPATSTRWERKLFIDDHAITGPTYSSYLTKKFKKLQEEGKIYVGTNR